MTRIALKLAFTGRAAWWVHALTTTAVGVGTALFLFALCVVPAMNARADRTAWMDVASHAGSPLVTQGADGPATYVTVSQDHLGDADIQVVSLAANGQGAPVPPGIDRLPGVDQVYVSPAMRELIRREPVLTPRYGDVIGLVDDAALAGPDHLLVVRGVTKDYAALSGTQIIDFPTEAEVPRLDGILYLLLLIGSVAMLAPIALFVAMATRLTAASRDERLARLRLAGAGVPLIRRLVLVESSVPGTAGALVGLVLFWVLRPAAAQLGYDGGRWFVDDLRPGVSGLLMVVVLVPVAAAIAAQVSLGAVIRSPLGSSARGAGRPVHWWRVVPLGVAIPVLIWITGADSSGGRNVMIAFVVLLVALIFAGPWFTRIIGGLLARSGRPAFVMAGRRLTSDPRAGFRSVAGVILAVLLSTLFVGSTPSAVASLTSATVVGQRPGTAQAAVGTLSAEQSGALLSQVRRVPGVETATLVYTGLTASGGTPANVWIGDCPQMVAAARLTSVPCGAAPVIVADNFRGAVPQGRAAEIYSLSPAQPRPRDAVTPAGDLTEARLPVPKSAAMPAERGIEMPGVLIDPAATPFPGRLRPSLLIVAYRDDATLEQVRSTIIRAVPVSTVATREDSYDGYNESVRNFYWLLTTGTTIVFVVAAAGLVIAMLVGLVERRRPLTLLRATGADVHILRGTLLLEAMAPLTIMAVLSAVAGAGIGVYISTPEGGSPRIPWAQLLLPVTGGLALALLVVALATLMVRHFIDTTRTRFE